VVFFFAVFVSGRAARVFVGEVEERVFFAGKPFFSCVARFAIEC
jgi:hypothetical protein